MITTLDSLTKHISALTNVVEANTIQVAPTLHSSMGAITEAVGKLESKITTTYNGNFSLLIETKERATSLFA